MHFVLAFWRFCPSPAARPKPLSGSLISQVNIRHLWQNPQLANSILKTALSSLIAWIMICACYTRFHKALAAQGIMRKDLDLRSWFQPYTAWICISSFSVILFFNGFEAFIHSFSVSGFFASYITLPVVALSFVGFRLYSTRKGLRVGFTSLKEINLGNGPAGALIGTKYDLHH